MNQDSLPNPFDPAQNEALNFDDVLSGITEEIEKGPIDKEPNFPFFWPLVYHDINSEIQQRYAYAVRLCYYGAVSFTWSLFFNFISSFFTEMINDGMTTILKDSILSLIYLLFYPAVLFYVQYYPTYVTFRDNKSISKISSVQDFVVIAMLFMCVGVRGSGMMGISYIVYAFTEGCVWNKIFGITFAIWHIINLVLQVMFKGTLVSIEEAREGLIRRDSSI